MRRALVVGIPLPHVTFDNYSFLSAPSLFDHDRVVVEMSSISDAVDQVVDGSPEYKTPGGRRYDWLPAPEGFAYAQQLLAGYGKLGVEVDDAGHSFAPYVEEFGVRLAFRAYVSEEEGFSKFGRVFARSPGGAAVGVELAIGGGRVVLLPPLGQMDYSRDRVPLANTLHICLERLP